ncbi:hypothetical protein GWI33_018705 [Rhynchophorus ferrugineus]|uniref:Uncharacterized protein n=1 Tax=Rhynchophorus ferrugineus TaxID=354439 RepID=A0A834HVB3_RHYFE|nr:hypothetical protein GWI33_018705 [Rhynchophorus ferrugineus]
MTTVEVKTENTSNTMCTYNEVAATKKNNENKALSKPQNAQSKAPKTTRLNLEWQPPKQINNKYKIKIRKEKASGAETLATIRCKLTRKELAGDDLKHTQKKDLIEKISSVRDIKIDNTKKRPKFKIIGVSREITDEQIIEDLADQNEEIMNIIQEERKKTGNNEEPEELIKQIRAQADTLQKRTVLLYMCRSAQGNGLQEQHHELYELQKSRSTGGYDDKRNIGTGYSHSQTIRLITNLYAHPTGDNMNCLEEKEQWQKYQKKWIVAGNFNSKHT